jgi:methylmalonyl-CoA mutase
LDKSDFKDTLDFKEFPPISTEKWESVIEGDLKGKNYKDILRWDSGEGVNPLPFYREESLRSLSHSGEAVSHSSNWCIIESIESLNVASANKEALQALENGALGLSFAPSENYLQSKEDLESLLEGVQIELITLQFQSVLSTKRIAGWLTKICKERGLDPAKINVLFNQAPLSAAAFTGKLASASSIREHLLNFGTDFRSCTINASIYGNAGATIVQQLGFALAEGNEYLGLESDLAERLNFNFSVGSNYFLEIAKIRAFKMVWAQVLGEYDLKEGKPYLSAETCLWNKSKTDAHNNMLRTTTEAMSAALGGADSITVHRYDQHFSEGSDFASRIARNTQIILQEEAYLNKVADPGSGSYYIEVLTENIAKKAWELFQEIEAKGGFYECLKKGVIQELISTSRAKKVQAYKEKDKVLVGVNKYQPEDVNQNLEVKIQNFDLSNLDIEFIEIETIELLNIEAELQNGEG